MSDVVRVADLAALGLTRSAVRAQLTARRWQRPTSTVLVQHNGPLTQRQRCEVALLTAGPRAVLAAWTALAVHGLRGWEREEIHLLVPHGTRPPSFGGLHVIVHESRYLPTRPSRRGGLPLTSVARSAVDAASWSATDRAACALLAAAVQQRLTRPSDLRAALQAPARRPRGLLLQGVVADIAGGAQALSELDFLRFCRLHRLPKPVQQQVRRDRGGRRRYLDVVFAAASGRLVRVEIDGSIHLQGRTYWDDMRRGNDLVLGHTPVLRFPSWVVRADDAEALDQLRRALAA